MGKKSKKKINNCVKEKKYSSGFHGTRTVDSKLTSEVVGDGVLEVKGRETCRHIENGIDLNKIKEKFSEKDTVRCEDCRGSALDRKESKGRSKHGKKGTGGVGVRKDTKCVWVCLQCGHFACGGVGMPNNPQSHAIRHSRQLRHPCVIQFENTNLFWCFPCDSLIPVGKSDSDGQEYVVLLDAVKFIKGGPTAEVTSVDVEDFWFGSGSGSAGGQTVVTTETLVSGKNDGYVVRGLANLGNTCFFNSVMQNILAMDLVRDFFMKLDRSAGPLTMALKKLFIETSCEASRNGISPKNLFGCICSKAPMFKGYQQQDSHELLRCLLDGLCTEELNLRKTLDSSISDGTSCSSGCTFVDAIFGGQFSSTVTCTVCRYSSVAYDPFLDLSLSIPKKKFSSKTVPRSRSKKAKIPIKKETKKGAKFRGKENTDAPPVSVHCATGSFEKKVSSSIASFSVPLLEEKVDSLDCLTWLDVLDYIEPARTPDTLDSVSENYNISTNQVSESKHSSHDDDMSHDSSEVQTQVFSPNIEPNLNEESSRDNMYENDLPVLQGSEVLLLPYKVENLTTDEVLSKDNVVPFSVLVAEQDSLDFDGFGDLFNEPEMSSVSTVDDNNSLMITQTASLSGICSESDPDQVDDSDAPVSINSCLSLYTEPELLSNEEAWNCENCAKIARGEQVYFDEKMPNTTLKKNDSQNVPLDAYLLSSAPEPRSLENGYPESDFGLTIERDNDIQSSYTPQEISVMTDCKSSSQTSFVDQAAVSFLMDGPDCFEVDVNQVLCMTSQSTVGVKSCKSNDSDKADGKFDKVPRDATKRILINKAPPILTIHLKRFSQDTRGHLSKLSGHVNFQDILDLSRYMNNSSDEKSKCEYQLIGVVEHSGNMRGGHYVAYVRGGKINGKTEQYDREHTWFYASDGHVREVSLAVVLRCEAYILFYEKV